MKIAIFYHTVFFRPDGSPFVRSGPYNERYMNELVNSGLMDQAAYFVAGINGGAETEVYAKCYLPRAKHVFHGIDCISANLTYELMRDFCRDNPGYAVLHFHSKGLAHDTPEYVPYTPFENRWINCMVKHCIHGWQTCVKDLQTYDSVGCHWMANVGVPPVDHIWGGDFWWATSDFVATLPSMHDCPLVKQHGIKSLESRATGEQWIGLGPRLPKTKDYCTYGIGMCP